MQAKTPKWLDLFHTAFGAHGIIALAWWAGAFHSERIRRLQGSYPILDISGDAGSGKTTLVSSLWRLTGHANGNSLSPSLHSFGLMLRRLAKSINQPAVIDRLDEASGPKAIDWSILFSCYCGRGLRYAGKTVNFNGALMVVTSTGIRLKHISTKIVLEHAGHSPEQSEAVKALYALPLADLGEFLATVRRYDDMAIYCMGKAEGKEQELLQLVHRELHPQDCINHGQLLALIDLLDHLFTLPEGAKAEAEQLVRVMAWQTVGRAEKPAEAQEQQS